MFNINRIEQPPVLENINTYNHIMIVSYLKQMYTKCHICNQSLEAGTTVEHILPKEHNEDKKLEWTNMVLCCTKCNTIKNESQIEVIDVTDCEFCIHDNIKYSIDGEMKTDNELIQSTINVYKLNRLELKRKRRRVLRQVFANKSVIIRKNSEFRGMLLSYKGIFEKNEIQVMEEE